MPSWIRYIPIALVPLALSCRPNNKTGSDPGRNTGTAAVDSSHLSLDSLHFIAEAAPEWTRLLTRNSGWFGGDGIFAVTRDGKESPGASGNSETLIWFSDTMLGEISGDSLQPGWSMIHNSVAVLRPPTPGQPAAAPDTSPIRFYWKKAQGRPASLFDPHTPASGRQDYYWLGDGFVNQEKNNDLYIFGYRIKNIDERAAFGFREMGNTLIIVPAGSQPPFDQYRQIDIPFFLGKEVDSTGSFGAGIYVNTAGAGAPHPDGYSYIYGIRGKEKRLMIARVRPAEMESFDKWTFWDGQGWNPDPAKIATVTDRLSNELGLVALKDGRYALFFQGDGLGKTVALRLAPTPYGPFGRLIPLYDCSRDLADSKNFFPYNAKVHPVLSSPDEWLITYNINSFDFFNDIKKYPHLYRPRFVRIKILP